MKKKYQKPFLAEKKIEVSYFFTGLDMFNPLKLVGDVYAQTSSGPNSGCGVSGGVACESNATSGGVGGTSSGTASGGTDSGGAGSGGGDVGGGTGGFGSGTSSGSGGSGASCGNCGTAL